jgi:hypothetical protein
MTCVCITCRDSRFSSPTSSLFQWHWHWIFRMDQSGVPVGFPRTLRQTVQQFFTRRCGVANVGPETTVDGDATLFRIAFDYSTRDWKQGFHALGRKTASLSRSTCQGAWWNPIEPNGRMQNLEEGISMGGITLIMRRVPIRKSTRARTPNGSFTTRNYTLTRHRYRSEHPMPQKWNSHHHQAIRLLLPQETNGTLGTL